jgi:hypothetical protein
LGVLLRPDIVGFVVRVRGAVMELSETVGAERGDCCGLVGGEVVEGDILGFDMVVVVVVVNVGAVEG